jgi:hypothetical protein
MRIYHTTIYSANYSAPPPSPIAGTTHSGCYRMTGCVHEQRERVGDPNLRRARTSQSSFESAATQLDGLPSRQMRRGRLTGIPAPANVVEPTGRYDCSRAQPQAGAVVQCSPDSCYLPRWPEKNKIKGVSVACQIHSISRDGPIRLRMKQNGTSMSDMTAVVERKRPRLTQIPSTAANVLSPLVVAAHLFIRFLWVCANASVRGDRSMCPGALALCKPRVFLTVAPVRILRRN